MKSLGDHILENANAALGARKKGQRDREPAAEAEPVRVIRSLDLDAATVAAARGYRSRDQGRTDE
jgi:hypothetical protein